MIDNNEIEKRLASALNAAAPDMLDDLMAELDLNEKPEPSMREKISDDEQDRYKKAVVRSKTFRTLISCAAAFILLVGGVTVWRNMNQKVLAVVDIDVNPSIELSINGKEKVVDVTAVNEDGKAILNGMNLKGSDIKTACNAIVGSMLTKGYLNDKSNSILLSVSSGDPSKGRAIETELSDGINSYMGSSPVTSAVLGQYVEVSDDLKGFAADNGISTGKAQLIRSLLKTGGTKMTEDSLLSLSTQELIVLGQERNVDGGTMHGEAYTGEYIGYESALAAALSHAGLDSSQVSGTEVEMDCENGVIVYEVEFKYSGQDYEYEINASTGEIMVSDVDVDDDQDDNDSDDDTDDDRDDADDDQDDADDDRDDADDDHDDHDDDND